MASYHSFLFERKPAGILIGQTVNTPAWQTAPKSFRQDRGTEKRETLQTPQNRLTDRHPRELLRTAPQLGCPRTVPELPRPHRTPPVPTFRGIHTGSSSRETNQSFPIYHRSLRALPQPLRALLWPRWLPAAPTASRHRASCALLGPAFLSSAARLSALL